MEPIITNIILLVIGILLSITLARWAFRINKRVENQETIIQLLGQLLLRNGMTEEEVKRVINHHIIAKADKLQGK